MSIEGFTCLLVFKNIFSFALTFKGFDWIVDAGRRSGRGGGGGIKDLFVVVGSVQVAICALTIPMCKFQRQKAIQRLELTHLIDIFGKKNRSFFHRYNIFFAITDWVADKLIFW